MAKKVIFLTVMDMYDKNGNGGVKCSQRNYTYLQKSYGKDNVILATFPREKYTVPPVGEITFERTQNNFQHLVAALLGCKVYFPWNEKKVYKFIEENGFDLICIDSSLLGRVAKIKGNFKKVIFFHNVEADYAKNKVQNEGLRYTPSYLASKKNEKIAIKNVDAVIALNARDSQRLEYLYGRGADFILPITLRDVYSEQKARTFTIQKNRLLFVGSFMPQNQAAIDWFLKEVMTRLTGITLDIVGKGFEIKKKEYEMYDSVNVIGEVDCLDEYYYSHEIVIIPLLYGAGMKIKTAEAMMYGKIILASDEALEGYDINGVTGIYRCNTANEYISKINELREDKHVLSNTRKLFVDKYDEVCMETKFEEFIKAV